MSTTVAHVNMRFLTDNIERPRHTFRVNDPRPNITSGSVRASGELLISADPFDDTVGSLTELEAAQLVETETRYVVAPPA